MPYRPPSIACDPRTFARLFLSQAFASKTRNMVAMCLPRRDERRDLICRCALILPARQVKVSRLLMQYPFPYKVSEAIGTLGPELCGRLHSVHGVLELFVSHVFDRKQVR